MTIDNKSSSQPIGKFTYLYEDKQMLYADSEIINIAQFTPESKDITVRNEIIPGNVWVKFTIVNKSSDSSLFLDLDYPNISEITLYRLNAAKIEKLNQTGNNLLYEMRQNSKPGFAFSLNVHVDDTATFYLKANSFHPLVLPMFIMKAGDLAEKTNSENLIFGLYFGIMLSLLLYNLFLFASTKDLSYLFYVIFLFFLSFAQTTISGYGFKYFWPGNPVVNRYALTITSAAAGITGILFSIFFLRIGYYFKNIIYILSVVVLLYIVVIISGISGNNQLSYDLLNYSGVAGGVLLIVVSYMVGKKGYKPAYFYFGAWIFFLVGIIVFSLRNFAVLPYTTLTTYAIYIGSAIEAILLSTALADRINSLRKEKEESQAYALKISQENENLIREQNVVLEQKVTERTNELMTTNSQLSKALDDLQDAQIQLVEAEKMASLGQLTAGIAHEINNPINFVKSNIRPLSLDIQDLFDIITDYNQLHDQQNGGLHEKLNEVYEKQESMDLNFIKTEIGQLIKGIEDGAERTAEIVRGLRTFSRLDESELKIANIHEGINSTIVLVRNTMPPYIRIDKDFKAKGSLECFPGKLNQVIMNILNNAIQAIGEKKDIAAEEYIMISTADTDDDKIVIKIKDTGPGMNDEVKHRIFEPFFTTKSVGVGTGLGMAIVFKIIQEHRGKIEIISELGKGAEFILTLPYVHPEA
ncbi:MAG TPA: 7TM diverse intracellular signaling domain-containing protein [Panacibacter sp.]|nr:7TM diverse intracellular signaling domain-containing protein [Panacibacter sp.]HNP46096.1 7TM diverse intracellular signaling domain-containing protein [Panacibacter sp.]